jgi:serine phosphatase RsbU (regulator of sigma subunit)/anti-sigma regulatory factor (Ser/Thr protein kinase)
LSSQSSSALRRDFRSSLRLEVPCEFTAVRNATLQVREWLAEKGVSEIELGGWELALVEAANNAVKYVPAEKKNLPVTIEISAGERDIEARITDHTAGFEWPEEIDLPDVESENGRGLFLIKSLTDSVAYLRNSHQNVMVMRRARAKTEKQIVPDLAELQAKLSEAEAALGDMTAELASSYESLVAMFRYSAELGAQADIKDFSQRLLRDLMQIAEADCAVLRLLSPNGKQLETLLVFPEANGAALPPVALAESRPSVEVGAARNRQDIWFDPEEPLEADDPLRAVMPVGNGICHAFYVADQLVGTSALGRLAADKPFTAAQVNLLHTFIDFLAIQIVNARLLDERTATRVTRRELEIAADIQRSLLPENIPACPPLEISASCQSALQVGGDFYDLIPAGDGAVLLVIADVMGKGVPAALFAAVLRSVIRSMPQLYSQPAELLMAVNRTIYADLSRVDMFATAQVVYLDPRGAKMVSASAGHCPLLFWQAERNEAVAVGQSGFPLGIERVAKYFPTTTVLPRGAAALLYTDGLSESRNGNQEMLGEKKLIELFSRAAAQTADVHAARHFLLGRIADFCNHAPLGDDQTLILIRNAA